MRSYFLRVPVLVTASVSFALAQSTVDMNSSARINRSGEVHGTMHLSPRPYFGAPVTGAPYTAQRVSELVQVGSDGTRFTTSSEQETTYRDSEGRTRTERPFMIGPPGTPTADTPLLVEISDPVAGVGYTLDTQSRIAHRYVQQAPGARQGVVGAVMGTGGGGGGRIGLRENTAAPLPPVASVPSTIGVSGGLPAASVATVGSNAGGPRPDLAREDLGTQMIEGVMAKGTRMVTTYPTGFMGNDRPFQVTSENWYSDELHLLVLTKSVDPRRGESTNKLININRADLPASLFAPPSDYTVVDETGPFEIQWSGTRKQ